MEDDDDARSATGSEVRFRIDPAGLTRAQQNLSTPRALTLTLNPKPLLTFFISQHHAVRQPFKTLAETQVCLQHAEYLFVPSKSHHNQVQPHHTLAPGFIVGSSQPGLPVVVVDRGGCHSGLTAAALPLCA